MLSKILLRSIVHPHSIIKALQPVYDLQRSCPSSAKGDWFATFRRRSCRGVFSGTRVRLILLCFKHMNTVAGVCGDHTSNHMIPISKRPLSHRTRSRVIICIQSGLLMPRAHVLDAFKMKQSRAHSWLATLRNGRQSPRPIPSLRAPGYTNNSLSDDCHMLFEAGVHQPTRPAAVAWPGSDSRARRATACLEACYNILIGV